MSTRALVIFLAIPALLTEAAIPTTLRGKNFSPAFVCQTRASVGALCTTSYCSVYDLVKITGMDFTDFVNLQNGQLGSYVDPRAILAGDQTICIGGYYISNLE